MPTCRNGVTGGQPDLVARQGIDAGQIDAAALAAVVVACPLHALVMKDALVSASCIGYVRLPDDVNAPRLAADAHSGSLRPAIAWPEREEFKCGRFVTWRDGGIQLT